MYTGNLTSLREFFFMFADGIFLAAIIHFTRKILSDILSLGRLSDILCIAGIFVAGSYTAHSLNSMILRYYLFSAYIMAFIVYRYSFYYLINDIISAVFSTAGYTYGKLISPAVNFLQNIFSPAVNGVKKVLNIIYSLSHQMKKVYNKYVNFFSHRREDEEEQKTEKS